MPRDLGGSMRVVGGSLSLNIHDTFRSHWPDWTLTWSVWFWRSELGDLLAHFPDDSAGRLRWSRSLRECVGGHGAPWWDSIDLSRWFKVVNGSPAEEFFLHHALTAWICAYYPGGPQEVVRHQLWMSRSHSEVVLPWELIRANLSRVHLRLA